MARLFHPLIRRAPSHLPGLDPRSRNTLADELGASPARTQSNAVDPHDGEVALVGTLVLDGSEERRHAALAQRRPECRVERFVGGAGHDAGGYAADLLGVEGCVFGGEACGGVGGGVVAGRLDRSSVIDGLRRAYRGPEMPPSLRIRQKWIARKMEATSGNKMTCNT